jgi:hypothetical protein
MLLNQPDRGDAGGALRLHTGRHRSGAPHPGRSADSHHSQAT